MANHDQSNWASQDKARILLADLLKEWRITWDELQQQRTGGPAAHRNLTDRLVELEQRIGSALAETSPPPR